jgi:predicted DCC family thiol-disulfide oxidoreductase YuxK
LPARTPLLYHPGAKNPYPRNHFRLFRGIRLIEFRPDPVKRTTFREAAVRAYMTIDGRSLGLFRIGLGLLLLVDLVRRFPHVRDFYTNSGILPNHTMLWRPMVPRLFSVFFPVSLGPEVWLTFAICAFCYVALLIGWRSRLFMVLSFLMATSLHNRIVPAENWGTVALGALMVWAMFLPLGRRFSVDALRASLRERPDEGAADLAPDRLPPPDQTPFVSLACLGVLLQLAVIYYFNCVHKSGPTWHEGTAIHYVLWQERIVTTLGLWGREHVPLAVWKALTWGTLVVEGSAPLLLLSPVFRSWTRAIAIFTLLGLHIGIALLVNVGIFSWSMVAYYPLLLTDGHWALLGRLVPKTGRARTVFYDASCGVCFQIIRVLARMDVYRRLTWVSNQDLAALPADVPPDLLERTILVVDPATNKRWTRSDAFAQLFAALPLGRLWAWPLMVPGLRQLAGAFYDLFARNRTRISMTFGLAACGIPGAPPPPRAPAPVRTPLGDWLRARLPELREVGVAFVMFVFAADITVSNVAVPPALRWDHRPAWMTALIQYPHIFQSWSMFSPDAPPRDYLVVVDAVTKEGRHVDPLNEVASRVPTLGVTDIPHRLGHDSFWCDYQLKIGNMPAYQQAFLEWLLRYPERTGRPEDTIVSLEASVLEHASPPPGQTEPTDIKSRRFLQWTQPPPAPPASSGEKK